ncbi:MAG: flippase [bacterium]
MSATRLVAFNTLVQLIARAVTTVASFLVVGYLARYLGVEGYGQYTLIFAYLALFSVIVDFGFFLLQVREVTKYPDRASDILGNILSIKLLLSVVAFGGAYLAARVFYHDPVMIQGIAIGSVYQAALSLTLVPMSLFQAQLKMHKTAIVDIIARLSYLGLVIWGIHHNVGLLGIILMISAINLAGFLVQLAWAWPATPITPKWDFKYWQEFLIEAWPMGLVGMLSVLYFRIDTVMLGAIKGEYAVGIYGPPYRVLEVVLTIPTMFMSSVFPVFTRALAESRERALKIFSKSVGFLGIVGLPIAFGVMAVGTPFMIMMAGADFAASGIVLKILIWAAAISFFGAVTNYSLIAAGRQKDLVWPYLVAAVFNIIANLIAIPHYSYIGAAIVTVVTEAIAAGYVAVMAYREFKFKLPWAMLLKALISAAVMVGAIKSIGLTNLWLNIAIGGAIYLLLVACFKMVDKSIVKELIRLK